MSARTPVAERGSRRILVLAPFPPRMDGTHGGARAVARLVRVLAEGNALGLMYLRASDEPAADPEVAAACEWVHEGRRPGVSYSSVRPWPRALAVLGGLGAGKPLWVASRWDDGFAAEVRSRVARWRPHVVQAEYTAMAQYLDGDRTGDARTVVTVYEPGAEAARERVSRSRPPWRTLWKLDARLWERFERGVLRAADGVVVFTERDRAAMERLRGTAHLERIPLGVELPPTPVNSVGGDPPELLFVGNFVHPPNEDAAAWLLSEIFPPLRARYPSLRLCIVGDAPPRWLRDVADERVEVTGRVPELAPYLDRASLVLAPLRQGGGMRVKVLEALAAGKAVVASPLAVEGMNLVDGEHAVIADGTEQIVEAVARLLDDPERRTHLAGAGRAWVAAGLDPARAARAYDTLYERLRAGPAATRPVEVP